MNHLFFRPALIVIMLFALQLVSFEEQKAAWGQAYPDFNANHRVIDTSQQLSTDYLMRIESSLSQYDFPVRVVYLDKTQNMNMARYASTLFKRWELPDDEMLLVVALDRRKIAVHAGKVLQERLQEDAETGLLTGSATPEPLGTPLPGETRKPAVPLDVSSEYDHLELIPEAIEQVKRDLQTETDAPRPSSSSLTEPAVSAEPTVRIEKEKPKKSFSLAFEEKVWIAALVFLALFLVCGAFGLRFFKRWRKDQNLVDRFAIEGQAAYELLEQTDRMLEAVMPDLHGYEGVTEKNLNLFIKSMIQLRDTYAEMFEDFAQEIEHLSSRGEREEAIAFFRELELKQEEGEQLHQQALSVLKNLKDVRQVNQQAFEQYAERAEQFSQELKELKQTHRGLLLTRTEQIYRQHVLQLKAFERNNEKDPLGVEKSLKVWRKELGQIEQETRALPHLWQQFKGDLNTRIERLERVQREKSDFTPAEGKNLQEVKRMHQTLQAAVMQGDLKQLNRWNQLFTQKLQELESRH
jgi:hypothetical protein